MQSGDGDEPEPCVQQKPFSAIKFALSKIYHIVRRLPFHHPVHIHVVANVCINNILHGQEDAISNKARSWIHYIKTWTKFLYRTDLVQKIICCIWY